VAGKLHRLWLNMRADVVPPVFMLRCGMKQAGGNGPRRSDITLSMREAGDTRLQLRLIAAST